MKNKKYGYHHKTPGFGKFRDIEFISPQPHVNGYLYTLYIRGINVGSVIHSVAHNSHEWSTCFNGEFVMMNDIFEPSARRLAKRIGERWFGGFYP